MEKIEPILEIQEKKKGESSIIIYKDKYIFNYEHPNFFLYIML